jgi:hypothetical protein
MKKPFYIKTSTWGTNDPRIISEEVMQQAERGRSYINPNDYMFLCDAESAAAAEDYYWDCDFSPYVFEQMAESYHP